MHLLLEIARTLFMSLYLQCLSVFLFIVRALPIRLGRKDITEEIVLVTGAGSGIGRLMAIKFARLGSLLVLWDINEEGNNETAQEIKKYGGRVHAYTVDLSNKDAIYRMADKVKQDVGDVTILVNNAGIVTGKKFLDSPDSLIQKTMEVNTMAHFWTVKSFLPSMMASNHGHIVTVASSAGLCGVSGLSDYCASKFGAMGFHEAMAMELDAQGKTGIHTTAVCPYYINTGMFDGIKTKFPAALPVLEPEYATDCIVDAVLTNQELLMMPRLLYFTVPLKLLLPWKVTLGMMDLFGISTIMNTFKGRQKTD